MLLTKLITVLPFGCMTLFKKSSLSNIVKDNDYFGRKGMALNIDVFFYNLTDNIQKKVYVTAATRRDQGMSKTIGLADLVLGEFKKEHPHVINIYGKSDNAGSYHGNFGAETLHKICKSINILSTDIFDTTEQFEEHILHL